LLSLLRCQTQSREYFHQDLDNNVSHGWGKRNSHINSESAEESLDRFEQFEQCIIARVNILYCLGYVRVTMIVNENSDRDIQRAGLRMQQILPLQVAMAMECTLGAEIGNKWLQTYYTDAFTQSSADRERVQDVNGRLE
jgi:hypothetical protein